MLGKILGTFYFAYMHRLLYAYKKLNTVYPMSLLIFHLIILVTFSMVILFLNHDKCDAILSVFNEMCQLSITTNISMNFIFRKFEIV